MRFISPFLFVRIPLVNNDFRGHDQAPGTGLAVFLISLGIQSQMPITSINRQCRREAAFGIGQPLFGIRAAASHFQTADFIILSPFGFGPLHEESLAVYFIADSELVFQVGFFSNGNFITRSFFPGDGSSQYEHIAQIGMLHFIKRPNKADTRLDSLDNAFK